MTAVAFAEKQLSFPKALDKLFHDLSEFRAIGGGLGK